MTQVVNADIPQPVVSANARSVVVSTPTMTVVAKQEVPRYVVAVRGVPGGNGSQGVPGPAGNAAVARLAGETISALRVVYETAGEVFLLDYRDEDHIDLLLGVTLTAGVAGAPINVQRLMDITDASWNWTLGRVYLGANGTLTQTPPADGYDVLIGYAVSPTRLTLNLQDPIEMEN